MSLPARTAASTTCCSTWASIPGASASSTSCRWQSRCSARCGSMRPKPPPSSTSLGASRKRIPGTPRRWRPSTSRTRRRPTKPMPSGSPRSSQQPKASSFSMRTATMWIRLRARATRPAAPSGRACPRASSSGCATPMRYCARSSTRSGSPTTRSRPSSGSSMRSTRIASSTCTTS